MADEPDYMKIANALTEQIESGELQPYDRLPSIADLVDAYGTSMTTVKTALAILKAQRLIYTRRGKGTYVAPRDGDQSA